MHYYYSDSLLFLSANLFFISRLETEKSSPTSNSEVVREFFVVTNGWPFLPSPKQWRTRSFSQRFFGSFKNMICSLLNQKCSSVLCI